MKTKTIVQNFRNEEEKTIVQNFRNEEEKNNSTKL